MKWQFCPRRVDDKHKHILRHQIELFGRSDEVSMVEIPNSNIITVIKGVDYRHDWLKEDVSDWEFSFVYRGSREGCSDATFHSKCDNECSTLIADKPVYGLIVGGYSNGVMDGLHPERYCFCSASGFSTSSPYNKIE